ncbi:hypothetical protein QBC38DRAFT_248733 [Podospora fimiseda]|uniref:F-box domain-containing protein n=1 Tax=Podospora fimiseda TaxID=252190 RepID=A0AAN7BM92_9PEZI|nr:hypothetical protein QBC38DRAFT_248733 [Podospora fimiseda]
MYTEPIDLGMVNITRDKVETLGLNEIYSHLIQIDRLQTAINPTGRRPSTSYERNEYIRYALRRRQALLSRPLIQGRNITDLPHDILYYILVDVIGNSGADKRILEARLVCRAFNNICSSHLFPKGTIKLSLSQRSLDRLQGLIKNPLIASSIRTVEIDLAHHEPEMALDLPKFTRHRLNQLRAWYRHWNTRFEKPDIAAKSLYDYRPKYRPRQNFQWIESVWNETLSLGINRQTEGVPDQGAEQGFLKLLLDGHKEFRRLQAEEHCLITGGRFVAIIAACIAITGNPVTVVCQSNPHKPTDPHSFSTSVPWNKPEHEWAAYEAACDMLHNEKGQIFDLIKAPLAWFDTDFYAPRPNKILPARILSELPIAIHKVGGILKKYHISAFPTFAHDGYIWDCIRPHLFGNWADLAAACSRLTSFRFEPPRASGPARGPWKAYPPVQMEHINGFLGAFLSGSASTLEHLCINTHLFELDDWEDGGNPVWRTLCADTVLSAITSLPRIQTISLMSIEVGQDALEGFFKAIGDAAFLRELKLECFALDGETWRGVLHSLKNALEAGRARRGGPVEIEFSDLYGGELGYRIEAKDWEIMSGTKNGPPPIESLYDDDFHGLDTIPESEFDTLTRYTEFVSNQADSDDQDDSDSETTDSLDPDNPVIPPPSSFWLSTDTVSERVTRFLLSKYGWPTVIRMKEYVLDETGMKRDPLNRPSSRPLIPGRLKERPIPVELNQMAS